METDAANAEGIPVPDGNIENAVIDSQEPEQGETSEVIETPEGDQEAAELSDEETVEKREEEKQKKRNSYQARISQLARHEGAGTRTASVLPPIAVPTTWQCSNAVPQAGRV